MTRLRPYALPAAIALLAVSLALAPPAVLIGHALRKHDEAVRWLTPFLTGAFADQLALTALVAALSAAVSVGGALPLALATSRYRLPGQWALEVCALSPLLLAPYTAAGAWAKIFDLRFGQGAAPMGIEIGLASLPWVYLLLRVAQARIPEAFEEVARVSGATAWQAFYRVRLKMLFAPCAAGALFAAARAFGDFGCAERNGMNTFGVMFHRVWVSSQSDAAGAALAAISCVPGLLLATACLLLWRRYVPVVPPSGGGACVVSRRRTPGVALVAFVWFWATCILLAGFLAPELQYLSWARDVTAPPAARVLSVGSETLLNGIVVCAVLALIAALTALAYAPGAPGSGAIGAWWLLSANLFFPPMAIALAWIVVTADGSPLSVILGEWRDTRSVVLLAQAFKFAPFLLLPVMDCLLRESPSLRATLRVCGLPFWRRVGHMLAFVAPTIALGAAFVFTESVKELDLAITLQPLGFQAVALKIHSLARFQMERQIAPWALVAQILVLPAVALVVLRLGQLDRH